VIADSKTISPVDIDSAILLFRNARSTILMNIVSGSFVLATSWNEIDGKGPIIWLVAISLLTIARLIHCD